MFRSWIPTVTGQLSFSVIGRTDWPERCVFSAHIERDHCKGIYVQERFTHDFLLPFFGLNDRALDRFYDRMHWLGKTRKSGRHYYFCIVDDSVLDDEMDLIGITGRVFAVPYRGEVKQSIERALARVGDCRHPAEIEGACSEIRKDIDGIFLIEGEFKLLRSGEFSLSVKASNAPLDFDPLNDQDVQRYAAQFYYFLRDISHNHQHHDGASDLIVRLHADDDNWAKKVYYDLYRNIIHFKRLRTDFHVTNASGLVAYSETFRELFLRDEPKKYFIQNTLLSLETAKYELQVRKSEKSNKIALTQTFAFGFLGSFLAITSLAQFADSKFKSKIEVSEEVIFLANWFIERTALSVVIVTFLSTVIVKLLGISPPERKRGFKSALRAMQSMRKNVHVLVYVAMGTISLLAGLAIAFRL